MTSVRKRLETLERSQSVRGGTSNDQIVRRVLERVSDADLDLLGTAARAVAQGRELRLAEWTAAEAFASAVKAGIGGREIIGRTAETMNMISRNLSRRLERLETSIMPT